MADVYFAYGKALLENAIAQNSVLGKEQQQEGAVAEGTWSPPIYLPSASSDELYHPVRVGARRTRAERE